MHDQSNDGEDFAEAVERLRELRTKLDHAGAVADEMHTDRVTLGTEGFADESVTDIERMEDAQAAIQLLYNRAIFTLGGLGNDPATISRAIDEAEAEWLLPVVVERACKLIEDEEERADDEDGDA